MAVDITYMDDPVFGRLAQLTNGLVDIRVTLDFGPRIIHASVAGMDNMLFMDKDKTPLGERFDVYDDQQILYGGHRIWISPEIMPRCYHPDNEPVEATPIQDGMTFTAAVEKHNQIQKIMTVKLLADKPAIKLTHVIRNTGLWDIELAPWCITMLDKGGQEIIPMPGQPTGFLPNRVISLWDYSEMNDSRVYWGKDYITLTPDATKANPFKLGMNNEAGWAAYFNKGQVFIKYFEPTPDGFYPDNGCCFETYTNSLMVEMETLGEFVQLSPEESVTHEEEWELYTAEYTQTTDEAKIQDTMVKFL